ncbi:MAG: hypothetical protein RSA49_00165 [Anaerovoracaceae bacterium]
MKVKRAKDLIESRGLVKHTLRNVTSHYYLTAIILRTLNEEWYWQAELMVPGRHEIRIVGLDEVEE